MQMPCRRESSHGRSSTSALDLLCEGGKLICALPGQLGQGYVASSLAGQWSLISSLILLHSHLPPHASHVQPGSKAKSGTSAQELLLHCGASGKFHSQACHLSRERLACTWPYLDQTAAAAAPAAAKTPEAPAGMRWSAPQGGSARVHRSGPAGGGKLRVQGATPAAVACLAVMLPDLDVTTVLLSGVCAWPGQSMHSWELSPTGCGLLHLGHTCSRLLASLLSAGKARCPHVLMA